MSFNKTQGMLGAALFATLLAVYFAPQASGDGVALSEHSSTVTSQSGPKVGTMATERHGASNRIINVLAIQPRSPHAEDGYDAATGVFTPIQWTPPTPKAATKTTKADAAALTTVPTPIQAPPLPFRVLGRYVEGDQVAVFLLYKDQNLIAHVGDTIAENYKVESLNSGVLTLLYTPLNKQQTLDVGGSN